ncbi:MAG: ABC transporter permease [Bacillota bacterium]
MRLLKKFYIIAVILFLYAPILFLMFFSFNQGKYSGNWEGFSLHWYMKLFQDKQIMKALYYTVTIAVLSSIIATVIGTLAAYGIFQMKKPNQQLILNVNNIPLLNPDIVTGVALMALYASISLKLGFITMLLSHITFCLPYVVLSVLPKLKQLSKDTVEAALDLGATPLQAFTKVILPEIMPGVVAGALIAFTLSVDDFVISFFTTGNGVTNLSITIYSMARRGISPEINALSTLMFITVITMLLIVNKKIEVKEL